MALAIPALEGSKFFLNADSTGVGKTRQILAVGKIKAAAGRKVLVVSTAAILKPEWAKGTINESGSMSKD